MYYKMVLLTSAGIVLMWLVAMSLGLTTLALSYVITTLLVRHLDVTMGIGSGVILLIILLNLVAVHEPKK